MTYLGTRPTLTERGVDAALAAARARAASLGGGFTIAIVDDSTAFRALLRMEGVDALTVGLAAGKARLAASNGMPTRRWRDIIAADPYLGLTLPTALNHVLGGAVLFGGGYPIRVEGTSIGGIGVSGGPEADDDDVAHAGLRALAEAEQFDVAGQPDE